jgi:hypothetical protein
MVGWRNVAVLTALIGTLAGCAAEPARWRTETAPAAVIAPTALRTSRIAKCAPINSTVAAEAQRITPLDAVRSGGLNALTAALMRSEAEKNARLRQAIMAYERCRQTR